MSSRNGSGLSAREIAAPDFDSIIVGAGFGGVRALYEMRKLGLSAQVFEAGSDVGGTWYWNRYPGARTDSESWSYCFFFSKELLQEWDWPERMPTWDQVQKYIGHTVDRFDLRKDIRFNTRIKSAHYDESANQWVVTTEQGERYTCTYFISAIGWFAVPCLPEFKGLETFKGETYLSSRWPKEPVDFTGKRVGIVGSGSTAVQMVPVISRTAKHLSLFQRTPNYVLPARNFPLDDADRQSIKEGYDEILAKIRRQVYAFPMEDSTRRFADFSPEQQQMVLDAGWEAGGFRYIFETFGDMLVDEASNEAACEFVRRKIRSIVKNPELAEKLCPRYPIALKRPPLCNFYYESFNRQNVSLVDISENAIDEILPNGIRVGDTVHEFDVIIFAMGFDAVTGPLSNLDVRGRGGQTIKEKWEAGPRTNLGIGIDGFPNLFIVTGPQAPFANVPPVVEAAVSWIGRAISHMRVMNFDRFEAEPAAVDAWARLMQTMVDATLIRNAAKQRAWFMGANIPGKAHTVLFYFGGAGAYFDDLERVADQGFPGFKFSKAEARTSSANAMENA